MTLADYVLEIVVPTLEDFRADRTSRRWAYLSAIAVYHLCDYLAEALAADRGVAAGRSVTSDDVRAAAREVDAALRAALPSGAFDLVRSIANGSKHGLTRQPHALPFMAGSDWARPAMRAGVGQAGLSRSADGTGGREIAHGDTRLDLYAATAATFGAFLAAFPAQLGGIAFEPYPEARRPP